MCPVPFVLCFQKQPFLNYVLTDLRGGGESHIKRAGMLVVALRLTDLGVKILGFGTA